MNNYEELIKSRSVRQDSRATRARLVAAAEGLFAERGIDSVSIAEINRAARQRNASALQYHFGGKEGLIHAILDKHTPGIEQQRHAMLDEIEASGRPQLRGLVEALVRPVAAKLEDPDGGIAFLRLSAQLVGHPQYPLMELSTRRVNRGQDRIHRLTAQACPELPASLWTSRWLLVVGLLFHGIADYSRLAARRERDLPLPARQVFVEDLIDSILAVVSVAAPQRGGGSPAM
jgi:AcrR family transcriptional regulator